MTWIPWTPWLVLIAALVVAVLSGHRYLAVFIFVLLALDIRAVARHR